jgi:hypothetical protein
MSGKKPKDWFIGKLVEETYLFVPDEEISKSPDDLFDYFTSHEQQDKNAANARDGMLFSYLSEHGLVFSDLKKYQSSGMFRAVIKENVFDFPCNWGPFRELESMSANAMKYVDRRSDEAILAEVISAELGYEAELVILTHEHRPYVAFIREGNEEDVEWIEKYLGLEQPVPVKKAA